MSGSTTLGIVVTPTQARDIRIRVARAGATQEVLARRVRIAPSLLSRYLRGRRPTPPEVLDRIHTQLDVLESAEQAAVAARSRVLAGAGS